MLVGIAVLDAEHLWIADAVTLPGIALGLAFPVMFVSLLRTPLQAQSAFWIQLGERILAIFAAVAGSGRRQVISSDNDSTSE